MQVTGGRVVLRAAGSELALAGRLDVTSVAEVRAALHHAVDHPGAPAELHVDVAALELVDATGLGVLVGAHRRAQRAGRRLVLVDVPDRLARVLFVTRLDRVLARARRPVAV